MVSKFAPIQSYSVPRDLLAIMRAWICANLLSRSFRGKQLPQHFYGSTPVSPHSAPERLTQATPDQAARPSVVRLVAMISSSREEGDSQYGLPRRVARRALGHFDANVGFHTRARFCASATCAGVIFVATRSRLPIALSRFSFSEAG